MTIKDIETWSRGLGLFPVPLHHDAERGSRFVLLNGLRGSFCLDLRGQDPDPAEARSVAWSANVGHYVALAHQAVVVHPWDRRSGAPERYAFASVAGQLEDFHHYLEKTSPDASSSVVSHGMRAFRGLRTALGKEVDGPTALKAFLLFLACAHEGQDAGALDLTRWEIGEEAVRAARHATAEDWSSLVAEFTGGRKNEALELRIDLLLRHASGFMFQEAHYEALLVDIHQMKFDFAAPEPARVRRLEDSQGLHFTPPALSRTLVEESLHLLDLPREQQLTVFDPACGSGELLREALRQLRLQRYSGRLRLIGWDISDAACAMARFALAWDLRNEPAAVNVEIRRRDSLADPAGWPAKVDILLMNPPFVSWQNLDPSQREALHQTLGARLRYRPDLSLGFLAKAAETVRPGGVLASFLPSSFLSGESAEPVRRRLSETLSARLVARLGSHTLFPGAIVEAAIYIGVAGGDGKDSPLALWSDYRPDSAYASLRELRKARASGSRLVYPVTGGGYSIYYDAELGSRNVSWSPRPYESWTLLKSLAQQPRVRQIFHVHQGSRTGHKRSFVLTREEWRSLPRTERRFFRPAVLNGSIVDGVLNDQAYAFFPYGTHEISAEAELKRLLPDYYARFLRPHRDALRERTRAKPDAWWRLSERRAWQEQPLPKLVSAYFGEEGSFAWDETGRFVVVQGFAWLSRTGLEGAIPRKPALGYLAIFNSHLFTRLLSASSNHVGGGQWDLSPRFVDEIPLPWLGAPGAPSHAHLAPELDITLLDDLSRLGETIFRRSIRGLSSDERERLEQAVEEAYRTGTEGS